MEELTLNFLGEETKIKIPVDLQSLKAKISEKFLLSTSDTNELILYYTKDNKKIYIINGNDYLGFKETNISTIFLDINQNSKLYKENATKLKKEKSEEKKDEKELNEILKEYQTFSEEKKEKVQYYYNELNEVMREVNKKRDEMNRKIHKALNKYYEKDEEYIYKIYCLQRKLNIPTTVRIPKAIKKQEEERINEECKKRNEEIRRLAQIKQKEKEEKKRQYFEHIKKLREEDEKKKKLEKMEKLKSTQRVIIKKQDFIPHESLRNIELEKNKLAFKYRTLAAATAASFIKAKKKENEKLKTSYEILENKSQSNDNKINTAPVFNKVNEVLNNTISQVIEVAKEHILKSGAPNKKDEKEIEKEKKEQIEKIKKITRDTVKEINRLTKMVIDQSNALIEKINNPEKNTLSTDDDNIILKASKKGKPKKEGIHFHVSCDGCKMDPIRGNRYKCKGCPNFDFCEKCYQKEKETHGHEFTKIERPRNTKRMGHKNKAYCGRGIVHSGERCEGCGLEPIVGWRFKCAICDDYNLCENCEENIGCKIHNHPFIKFYYSLMEKDFDDYHLKLNSYEPTKDTK
jgi:hypothetical protein